MKQCEVVKSIGYSQEEIINNILKLYNKCEPIDFDPCFNIGGFYKSGIVSLPEVKSDIYPLLPGVEKLDVTNLPYEKKFKCIIFDPPFLIKGGNSDYKMIKRYSCFNSKDELINFYNKSFISLHRALKHRGILILKTQDFVHARENHILLPEIISMARDNGFKVIDLFILLSRSRIINIKNQQHARKYHSYFLVLKKLPSAR